MGALARRYRDEPVVAAYDLLNEPLAQRVRNSVRKRAGRFVSKTDRASVKSTLSVIVYEVCSRASPMYIGRPRCRAGLRELLMLFGPEATS